MSDIDFFYVGGGIELTVVGSNASAIDTVPLPVGSAAGDLAVLFDLSLGGSPAFVTPSGFTAVVSDTWTAETALARISYGILSASDITAGVITGMTAGNVERKTIVAFRPSDAITSVVASTPNTYNGATDPPNQTVSASGQPIPLIVIGCQGEDFGTLDMASSPAFDGVQDVGVQNRLGWAVHNLPTSDHVISATGSGAARALYSFYLRVS